jgi:hypothetical protein
VLLSACGFCVYVWWQAIHHGDATAEHSETGGGPPGASADVAVWRYAACVRGTALPRAHVMRCVLCVPWDAERIRDEGDDSGGLVRSLTSVVDAVLKQRLGGCLSRACRLPALLPIPAVAVTAS